MSSVSGVSGRHRQVRVVVLINHFLPGQKSGGPARTMANVLAVLGGEYAFDVITRDRDLGDQAAYEGVDLNTWTKRYGGRIYYASPQNWSAASIIKLLRQSDCDIVYINGIYGVVASIIPLIAWKTGLLGSRGLILAPRGSLAPSARAIKSGRKEGYLKLARWLGLFRGVLFQASSDFEADDIRNAIPAPALKVHVAPDLLAPLEDMPPHTRRSEGAPFRLCTVARVVPVKNIDFAIRVLGGVTVPVAFTVYGPHEDAAYLAHCQSLAAALPSHVQVNFAGPVAAHEVPGLLAQQDLMFLPSKGENFGHVIPEALSAGTPVLVSDRTPWRNLRQAGVGFDLPLDDPPEFVRAIEHLATLAPGEAQRMRQAARNFAERAQTDRASVQATRQLFEKALAK